jgi:hypothetical protein
MIIEVFARSYGPIYSSTTHTIEESGHHLLILMSSRIPSTHTHE